MRSENRSLRILLIFVTFALLCVLKMRQGEMAPAVVPEKAPVKLNLQENSHVPRHGTINIIAVIEQSTDEKEYEYALDTMKCYAKIHSYSFRLIRDEEYMDHCKHKDRFFRRHCIVALLLNQSDYTLFVDADIGVVNPTRQIEEFIDPKFDIIFYDRFYNQEVVAGSYLVKNSDWSRKFLNDFADYEVELPHSFNGTDNAALHAYLADVILPGSRPSFKVCRAIWETSVNWDDIFSMEVCYRAGLGIYTDFDRIRIMKKMTGWAHDTWTSNSLWDPKKDFMIHGWKHIYLRSYGNKVPNVRTPRITEWYYPLAGRIQLDLCHAGNTTWSYDRNLIANSSVIDPAIKEHYDRIELDRYRYLARIPDRLSQMFKK